MQYRVPPTAFDGLDVAIGLCNKEIYILFERLRFPKADAEKTFASSL